MSTILVQCRFAGYGRRSGQKRIKGSNGSWTMFSTNLQAYCVMSESLDPAL